MSKFLTTLQVEEVDEFAGTWRLVATLFYKSDLLGRVLTVPAGFVTDFASVPRILGVYDLEGGKCNKAAVVHDWLYSTQGVTREQADQVLREAILASGYSAFTGGVFYAAVSAFGASHWTKPNVPQALPVDVAMKSEAAIAAAMRIA